MCKKGGKPFKVTAMNNAFTSQFPQGDYEKYVLVHSSAIKELNGDKHLNDTDGNVTYFDGVVCVKSEKGKQYRKCIAKSQLELTQDKVEMGYRTRAALKVDENDIVYIHKSNGISYLCHHIDPTIKHNFWLALIGIILSLIGILISIFI